MPSAFLSYAKSARSRVEVLGEDLSGLGYDAWFDQSLEGGQHWWDEILHQIRECNCFIFCLTRDSLDSQACQLELGYAVDLGKTLLPVLLDEDVQSSLLPPSLAPIQHIDYTLADKAALTGLSRALAGLPDTPALPASLPEPPAVPVSELGHVKTRIDDEASLDADEQESLFFTLKSHLKDPQERKAARQLLASLRKRRDLLAYLADEIDDALAGAPAEPAPERHPPPSGVAATQMQRQPQTADTIVPMRFVPDLTLVKRAWGKVRWTDRVEMPTEPLMDLAAAAIRELGYTVKEMHALKLTAKSGVSIFSWGEVLTVELARLTETTTDVTIESSPAAPLQVVDWGKSVRNVRSILEKMAFLAAKKAL